MLEATHTVFDRVTEFFIPPELREGQPQIRRQMRLIMGVCANILLITPILCALFVVGFDAVLPALFVAMASILMLASPWLFQKTSNITLSTNWLCLNFYLGISALITVTGGHGSAAMIWYFVVPLIAGTVSGWRIGSLWTTLIFGSVVGFYVLDLQNFVMFQTLTASHMSLFTAVGFAGVGVMIGTTGLLSEQQHSEAQDRLKAANAELADARDKAEIANRAKGVFLANMSHEIRTPMNAVIGTSGLLISSGLTDDQSDLARTIQGSGEMLLELLDSVLDFSRLESGEVETESEEFVLSAVLEEAFKPLRARAESKGLALRCEIGPGVPAAVFADPRRLRQALAPLVNNAVKFTATGHALLSVRCEQRSGKDVLLTFEMQDTGVGIAAEAQPHLFEAFTQADGSFSRDYDGAGLGLAMSSRVVDALGGELGFESTTGDDGQPSGTTFWFSIPVEERELIASDTLSEESVPQARPEGVEPRILVAEDNAVNQRLMARMLEKLGYPFDLAENGKEAVTAFDAMPYDLVLMDCHMPEMDGFEATAKIRGLEPAGVHTPIIAVTANVMKGDRERCLAAGMDDYLPKPLTLDVLAAALLHWSELRAAS